MQDRNITALHAIFSFSMHNILIEFRGKKFFVSHAEHSYILTALQLGTGAWLRTETDYQFIETFDLADFAAVLHQEFSRWHEAYVKAWAKIQAGEEVNLRKDWPDAGETAVRLGILKEK